MYRLAVVLLGLATAGAWPSLLAAQEYPTRPVKIVVGSPPGGGTDILARLLAEKFSTKWGQPAVVENKGGSGGNIGAESVFRSSPDGHTMLIVAQGALVINKSLYRKLAYDPDNLVPITLVATTPSVLLIHPRVPADTVPQLVTWMKANPDKLNFASQGVGTAAHLTGELFKSMAGVSMVHVPYRGTGPAIVDLLAGEVGLIFGELVWAMPYIKRNQLKLVAVASGKRSAMTGDLPAVAETLPGFVSLTWWGMVAPPGTSPAIAEKIAQATNEALKAPDVAQRLADLSVEGVGNTPAEFAHFMKAERELWGKVVRDTGASAD